MKLVTCKYLPTLVLLISCAHICSLQETESVPNILAVDTSDEKQVLGGYITGEDGVTYPIILAIDNNEKPEWSYVFTNENDESARVIAITFNFNKT